MPRNEGPAPFDEFSWCHECGQSMARHKSRDDWRPFGICAECACAKFEAEDPVRYQKARESAAFSLRVLKERPSGWY